MLDVENISIDKDCLDFLQDFLFKSTVDHYVACSRRAYLESFLKKGQKSCANLSRV